MKQAYLEMALVLISNANKFRPPKTPDVPSRSTDTPARTSETPSTPGKERKMSKKGSGKKKIPKIKNHERKTNR